MKIAIDCRMLDSSGVGVYLLGCLPFFLDSPHNFVLIGNSQTLTSRFGAPPNVRFADCGVKPFSIGELAVFPRKVLSAINTADAFFSPYFNIPGRIKVPVYTTIHDIIFPDMPELTSKAGLAARMWFYRRAARISKKIFTVSDFSKSRIEHFLGSDVPVIVTYSALQPYLMHPALPAPQKKKIMLFIGNIKKHKGLSCLLEAFSATRKEGLRHKLVVVGSKDNFRSQDSGALEQLSAMEAEALEFTGFISDERLRELLAEAALLVQPSLYEGFGLPPLEAMVSGTEALISDIPVFKEIYDGFPVNFFKAGDSRDLKNKLMELLYNKEPKQFVLPRPLAEKYSFRKTAATILRHISETA
jgi:glycosyltransferase involved in cell wall biosynthesis